MAKIVPGLSEIYSETDTNLAEMLLLTRLANMGELCRLRDGKNTFPGADSSDTHRHRPWEAEEERDRSGRQKEYGFGSPRCAWRDRRDRRAGRARGHRAGKK